MFQLIDTFSFKFRSPALCSAVGSLKRKSRVYLKFLKAVDSGFQASCVFSSRKRINAAGGMKSFPNGFQEARQGCEIISNSADYLGLRTFSRTSYTA